MGPGKTAKDLRRRSKELEEKGDIQGAVALLREALAVNRARLGSSHHEVAKDLNNLALRLVDLGSLDEAERLYGEAISIGSAGRKGPDPGLGTFYGNLAFLLEERGDWERAIATARRAVEVAASDRKVSPVTVVGHRKALGIILKDAGRWKEAIEVLEGATDKFRTEDTRDVVQAAQCLSLLAEMHHAMGEDEEADRDATESVRLLDADGKVPGATLRKHLSNLGTVREARGDLAGAAQSYWRAITLDAAEGREATLDSLIDQVCYGRLLRRTGRIDDAETVIRSAMARLEGGEGTGPYLARALYDLGEVMLARGLVDEAERLFGRALATGREHGDEVVVWMAWCYEGLSAVRQSRGDAEGAQRMLERGLGVYRKCLKSDHPYVLRAAERLQRSMEESAERKLVSEVEVVIKGKGRSSEDALDAQENLANFLFKKGKYAEAISILAGAVDTERAARGEVSARLPDMMERLSNMYQKSGDKQSASRTLDEAIRVASNVHGERSERYTSILGVKARWFWDESDYTSYAAVVRELLGIHRAMYGEVDERTRSDVLELHDALKRMPEALVDAEELSRVDALANRITKERLQQRSPAIGTDLESLFLIRDSHEDCIAFLEALFAREKWFGDGTPFGVERNRALAKAILCFKGDSAEHLLYAETLLRRALAGQRALPARDPACEALLLADLGLVLSSLAMLVGARNVLEKASGVLNETNQRTGRTVMDALVSIGDLEVRLSLPDDARRDHGEALKLARDGQLVGSPFVGRLCHRLAEDSSMTGDIAAARDYARLALEADTASFGEGSPFVRRDRQLIERLDAPNA